jgi:hypothetical protein
VTNLEGGRLKKPLSAFASAVAFALFLVPALAQAGENGAQGIPTLGEFGLATMGGVLAAGGVLLLVRRRRR